MRSRTLQLPSAIAAGATGMLAAVLVSGGAYAAGGVHLGPDWPLSNLTARLTSYAQAADLIRNPQSRVARTELNMAAMRSLYGLSAMPAAGTQGIDVIPWDIEVVYGYGLRWDPRPVLQSYMAYTPYLDRADAMHLAGADAPDRLLISNMSIDGRYPTFDEPAAFRAVASHYQVVGRDGSMLLLSRRPSAPDPQLRRLGTIHSRIGQSIAVPDTGAGNVYAVVRVPYSARGHLMNLVFQPAQLRIRLIVSDGGSPAYRFIPAVAEDGLLVNDYVGTTTDLRAYLQGQRTRSIRSFEINSENGADYTGAVDVTFYAST